MIDITSLWYLLLVFAALIIYWTLPNKARWVVLLCTSLVFFVCASGWKTLPYLLYGVVVSYFGARAISDARGYPKLQKRILIITLVLIIAELFVLKYVNFFVETVNIFGNLFSIGVGLKYISIIGPIGISYYTVSLIGYVLDVYWGIVVFENNFFRHTLFACYFPQMTSGPMTQYGKVRGELFGRKSFDWELIRRGALRILLGFFKKLVIADRLAGSVALVFADNSPYKGAYILIGVLCFAFQIFCDFTGCMDIVLGTSEMFGVKYPENFRQPFFSKNISEFWRRWHITLGVWFKNYLLFPLLKSDRFVSLQKRCRKRFGKEWGKRITTYLGLLILWIVIGFWHGGSWVYIFCTGLIPWVELVLGEILEPFWKKVTSILHIKRESIVFHIFASIKTVLLMCFIWLFVCAGSITGGFEAIGNLFQAFDIGLISLTDNILGLYPIEVAIVALGIILIFWIDVLEYRGIDTRARFLVSPLSTRWVAALVCLFVILIYGIYGPGYDAVSFIYGGF